MMRGRHDLHIQRESPERCARGRPIEVGSPALARAAARTVCFAAVIASLCYALIAGPGLLALDEAGRDLWLQGAWLAAPSLAAGACLEASRRSRGTDRRAWRFLGAGCVLWALGTLTWSLSGSTFPSFADAAYILTCVLLVPGMYYYGIDRRQVTRVQILNLCLFLGAVNVSAFYLLADEMQESKLTAAGTLIAFVYPVAWFGTAAFGAMCMLLYAPRHKVLPFTLLILGVLSQGLADLFYALDLMGAGYEIGATFDVLWVLCFLMIAWSAAEHSAAGAPRPRATSAPSQAQRTAEAFVPAAALSLVGAAGAIPGVAVHGHLFLLSVPAVILLAFILGLREHWAVTSERDLRRAAARTGAQLAKVLEATTDSVGVIDRDWRITYLNNRALRMFKDTPGFEVGSVLWDIFPSEEHATFRRHYERAFETQQAFQIEEFLPREGIWLQVHISPSPDSLSLFFRDVTERKLAVAKLEHLANHDPLTGLSNRRSFHERLASALSAPGEHPPVVVLFLDLDHFKEVNDTDGHPVGDALLVEVGRRIRSCAGEVMEVARTGGDEFAILLTGHSAEARAEALSRSLIDALALPFDIDGRSLEVGVSIGIAASRDNETADQILVRADIALYEAKSAGRGNYRFFNPDMEARLRRQHELKSLLSKAIENAEFTPFYQPVIDLRTSRVTAFEALLRWRQPELGFVPPAEFIPIAEETGLIHSIGEWMLRRACMDAARWPEEIGVAVNLSPCEFRNRDLPAQVASILAETGLSPSRLDLEITESVFLQDTESNMWALDELRELGVRIVLDDFGVGYSSLGYLRRFPVEKIKLDRSFVEFIEQEDQARAVMSAVIALGRSLGMTITAEGIETAQQLESVRRNGCDQAQGYLLSPPVPAIELPALLDRLERLRRQPDMLHQVV